MTDFEIGPGPDVLPAQAHHVAARWGFASPWTEVPEIRDIPVPRALARATPTRRAEYRLGRCCARAALEALGVGATIPGRDDVGVPLWPAGVVGSITHTDGHARAAVASCADAKAIGVDTERVLSLRRAQLVASTIAEDVEIAVGVEAGLDRCEAVTLAFSAKEAVFKCLHRLVGRRFGFADACVLRVDGRLRTFTVQIATTLSDEYSKGATLTGAFAIESGMLHTGLLLRADAAASVTTR